MNDPSDAFLTITLTRHREPDWLVLEALDSLSRQDAVRAEILFLDQIPSTDFEERVTALGTATVEFRYEPVWLMSLARARNEALARARSHRILFLDPDVVVGPRWAAMLSESLAVDEVAVVGARIVPRWLAAPLAVAASRLVLDQYSVYDLGPETIDVARIVGASFAIDRTRLGDGAYFKEGLGRRDGLLLAGEETELCHRARGAGLRVVYDGRVTVEHQIPPERISYRWVLRRFFHAGATRALLGGQPNPSTAFSIADYLVLPLVLPSYCAGYVWARRNARK